MIFYSNCFDWFSFRNSRCGTIIINDDTQSGNRSLVNIAKIPREFKIDRCKCSYCTREMSSQSRTDPWFETKDPCYLMVRSVLANNIDNFFRMSIKERQSYVQKAISYLTKYDTIHPIHEMVIAQSYLQNYWILTTAQSTIDEQWIKFENFNLKTSFRNQNVVDSD